MFWDNSLGQDWRAKKRPRMNGARSSGVTGHRGRDGVGSNPAAGYVMTIAPGRDGDMTVASSVPRAI